MEERQEEKKETLILKQPRELKKDKSQYNKNDILKTEWSKQTVSADSGKEKIFKIRTFKNGVKKTELKGMKKDGKIIFDHGVDWAAI